VSAGAVWSAVIGASASVENREGVFEEDRFFAIKTFAAASSG
jgi:hypothetical protein